MSLVAQLLATPSIARIFSVFDGEGECTRIAGGAVRDVLSGRMPVEVDFATTALPQEVMQRAEAAGLKAVPTGFEHGTVSIILHGTAFEITTLRRDVETDGRHARVVFGRDWQADALRRDFTINGLFLDRSGEVLDFVGGQTDLAARRVRFIGEARQRIREDYLRILRFFRFFAGYADGAPDAQAFLAAITEREGLKHLSRERVRAELLKLLVTTRAADVVKLMADAGLLGLILACVPRCVHLARLIALEKQLGLAPDAIRRLGALTLFIPDNASMLQERLRLSNGEAERLRAMAAPPVLDPGQDELSHKIALYHLEPDGFRDRVLFNWAGTYDQTAEQPGWANLFALPERWSVPKFPIAAADLMAAGVEKGPRLGLALSKARALWLERNFPQDDQALREIIRESI